MTFHVCFTAVVICYLVTVPECFQFDLKTKV